MIMQGCIYLPHYAPSSPTTVGAPSPSLCSHHTQVHRYPDDAGLLLFVALTLPSTYVTALMKWGCPFHSFTAFSRAALMMAQGSSSLSCSHSCLVNHCTGGVGLFLFAALGSTVHLHPCVDDAGLPPFTHFVFGNAFYLIHVPSPSITALMMPGFSPLNLS